jgi:hypothetical protein
MISRSRPPVILLILLILSKPFPSFAHDPYEITSTLSLYSNRTELSALMEFRTALLLANQPPPLSSNDVPEIFTSAQPALQHAAEQLFQLHASANELHPDSITVTREVEDHLQFKLSFPVCLGQPLQLKARGLEPLTNQGPYGATVTVLDMVNQKVLGQTVLFAITPAADFAPARAALTQPSPTIKLAANLTPLNSASAHTVAAPASAAPAITPNPLPSRFPLLFLFIFIPLTLLALWFLLLSPKPKRNEQTP